LAGVEPSEDAWKEATVHGVWRLKALRGIIGRSACLRPRKKNLSNLLLSLNLLAFLFHTLLELYDPRYRMIRQTLPRRDRFFNDVKALTQYMLFESWEALMLFMLEGLDLEDPGG
jgi:hypothetical protein